jgi:mannosyl-3-phosphoglycerate phosphatase
LLDTNYDWRAADAMMQQLRARQIPLVLSSSKTCAELSLLCRKMQHCDPYIAENGGVLVLPSDFLRELGYPYALNQDVVLQLGWNQERLLPLLNKLVREARVSVRTFHQMRVEEIAQRTGLSVASARRARQRQTSLPFYFENATPGRIRTFLRAARRCGARVGRGARFWHLTVGSDKGDAMKALILMIRILAGGTIQTIAAGDAPIDLPMLMQADVPILFPRSDATVDPELERALPKALHARGNGPAAWTTAIERALSTLNAHSGASIMNRRPAAAVDALQALVLHESFASLSPASRWKMRAVRKKAASRSLFP